MMLISHPQMQCIYKSRRRRNVSIHGSRKTHYSSLAIMLIKTALALLAAGSAMQGAVAGINLRSWDEAHELAKAVTDKMSLEQWVNITTGKGKRNQIFTPIICCNSRGL